jgi:NAD(P)-dependent dehydrogenase (short-subunit alcohol dehydrogenase family)
MGNRYSPGKLAVVTGAGRGLGRALAAHLAQRGWTVVACVRTAAAGTIPQSAGITTVVQDVRDPIGDSLLQVIGSRPVDALINNAGAGAPRGGLGQADPATVLTAVDVNAVGPLRFVQALLPNLLSATAPLIINISSRLGSLTAQAAGHYADLDTSYAYRMSKAAQNMLTIALAQELAGQVRCWAVHPGTLTTGMGRDGAATSPEQAAEKLACLLDSPDTTSPRYCSLTGSDLTW